jgi:serine/threonine protein kinase
MSVDIWSVHLKQQANILISSTGHVRLADFGISSVVDADVLRWTSLPTITRPGGTIRWMAPELIGVEDDSDTVRPTFASDVYSFASVAYEVRTLCRYISSFH